jgi:negative regulator of flagellin synthesis FlgM
VLQAGFPVVENPMKIGSPMETQGGAEVSLRPAHTTGGGPPVAAVPANSVAATDQVQVSAAGAQMSALGAGDFNSAKVDAIRQAIREGRFTVNPEAIADRLIADAAALLGPRSS